MSLVQCLLLHSGQQIQTNLCAFNAADNYTVLLYQPSESPIATSYLDACYSNGACELKMRKSWLSL